MSDVSCPACGGATHFAFDLTDLQHSIPGTFEIHTCESCGSGVTLPLATERELAEFYPSQYYTHTQPTGIAGLLAAIEARRFDARLGLDRKKPGRLLEIGPGNCALLLRMKARGWKVTGFDPDPVVVAAGRSLGLAMEQGSFLDVRGGPYDAIVSWQSLEHSISPREDIKHLAGQLAPGGTLVIGVPDFGSRVAGYFRAAWFHLDPPRHRTHFTRKGLERVLAENGLEIRNVHTWLQPYALLVSWRFSRGEKPVRVFDAALARIALAVPARIMEWMGRGDLMGLETVRKDRK